FALSSPLLLSSKRAARTAITPAAGRHWNEPPSEPKQGGAPAPRQGAPGPGGSCAQAADTNVADATIANPNAPNNMSSVADLDVHRIACPFLARFGAQSYSQERLGATSPVLVQRCVCVGAGFKPAPHASGSVRNVTVQLSYVTP